MKNRIMCRKCLDIIESENSNDFVTCSCGAVSVDGGLDYFRRRGSSEDILELSFPEKLEIKNENKLPIGGKRYRFKDSDKIVKVTRLENGYTYINAEIEQATFSPEDFLKYYEELPEDKVETNATGIKDKNGHEIHVGDFIKRGRLQGIVKFFDNNDGRHYFITDEKEGDYGIMAWESNKLEIIIDPFKARWSGEKFEIKPNCGLCEGTGKLTSLTIPPAEIDCYKCNTKPCEVEIKPETQSLELSPEVKEEVENS